MYVSQTDTLTWERIEAHTNDGTLKIAAQRGGMYVATNQIRGGAVAGIVIGVLVLVGVIILTVVCVIRKPPPAIQRAFANKI